MKKLLFIAISLFFFLYSCEKESVYEDFQSETLLRQIGNSEEDMQVITYYNTGNVFEDLSRFSYRKFTYNNEDQLSKIEIANSINPLSCAIVPGATYNDGDDPRKAKVGQKVEFEYNEDNSLKTRTPYILTADGNQKYLYNTFEYENERISKMKTYNNNDELMDYSTYQYDNNGNVIQSKLYLYNQETKEVQLFTKKIFEFDNKKNPFNVFKVEGTPGIKTNTNNIIRQTDYFYNAGLIDSSSFETTYEYNKLGYPIEVNNVKFEYGKSE